MINRVDFKDKISIIYYNILLMVIYGVF